MDTKKLNDLSNKHKQLSEFIRVLTTDCSLSTGSIVLKSSTFDKELPLMITDDFIAELITLLRKKFCFIEDELDKLITSNRMGDNKSHKPLNSMIKDTEKLLEQLEKDLAVLEGKPNTDIARLNAENIILRRFVLYLCSIIDNNLNKEFNVEMDVS